MRLNGVLRRGRSPRKAIKALDLMFKVLPMGKIPWKPSSQKIGFQ